MTGSISLRLALDRYDRHVPFFDGTVPVPSGLRLDVLQVGQSQSWRDGGQRHERMYHESAFDACEFGLSPYVMMHDRDSNLPFLALPVFPRRLFSQSQIFVRPDSDITQPQDLVGRRVALRSFHTTLSVLTKGDLKFYYGVPWEEVTWCPSKPELIDYELKDGVRIDPLPDGVTLAESFEAGMVDAIVVPHLPKRLLRADAKIRRLIADSRAEETRYYRDCEAFPIMHLLVIRRELLDRDPWLGPAIVEMFADAKRIADSYLDDPNWSRLVWGRHYAAAQQAAVGDPWPVGFAANRENIARFIKYAVDQNLITRRTEPEALFPESVLNT